MLHIAHSPFVCDFTVLNLSSNLFIGSVYLDFDDVLTKSEELAGITTNKAARITPFVIIIAVRINILQCKI